LVSIAVQVEQIKKRINLNLDLTFIVGLPLPFRIKQAKSKGSFITQYLFETGKHRPNRQQRRITNRSPMPSSEIVT
jgi:hypothetical protein